MAHRYGRPVHVSVQGGTGPASFRWLGVEYPIRAVLATWHPRDRWWAAAPTAHVPARSDRT